MEADISNWVKVEDPDIREFREAVHTILVAISSSPYLNTNMIMKGGILLAIEFKSTRFTKDIDFSTDSKVASFDIENFKNEFSRSLSGAVEALEYDLDCKIQSYEMKPPREDATFPTFKIRIGYAYKGTGKHKHLINGKCSTIVEIDYSFNELNTKIDTLDFLGDRQIKAYSVVDVAAEKYRALIQQKTRNRTRRQDAYDLYFLITKGHLAQEHIKKEVLSSLILKAESRNLEVYVDSLRDPAIIERSKVDYHTLAQEIEGELPPFEEVYGLARDYYEALPW